MKAPKFNLKKIAEKGARTMKVYGMAAKTAAAIWGADYDLNDEQLSILEKAILAAYIA